jgi:NADH:ubiquinone oxidoreductase subunit 5 (subunit L)/multisubunit Na+/H+ antiporter MnhA subunit
VFGLAYLAVVLAAAIRFGAIPFHRWAARLADSAPEIALPLLLAWAPAGFAVVALAWVDRSIAPLLLPLQVERATVLAVGVATIVLGAAAAWLQDDLEHVVGYSIVQDAGFVILGLAILDPVAWQPTRTWILVFVVAKTAFAAWAVAARTRFGTRRIADLGGWARRSPGLAVALVVIATATLGVPGLVAWQVRAHLVELSVVEGPFRVVVMLGGLASLAYYGRVLAIGLREPSALVAAAPSERPRRSTPPAAAIAGSAAAAGAFGDEADIQLTSRTFSPSIARFEPRVVAIWTANRAPIASVGVLVLALTALAVAAGALGGPAAAAAPAPEPVAPSETFMPGQTEPPSPGPGEQASPGPRQSAVPGESPGPLDTSAPSDRGGPSLAPLPSPSP